MIDFRHRTSPCRGGRFSIKFTLGLGNLVQKKKKKKSIRYCGKREGSHDDDSRAQILAYDRAFH